MSTTQLANTAQPDEVPCLLVPLHSRRLLMPTVSVAEMVPMGPCRTVADAPDWFLGYFEWRGVEVPLLSFEKLNGETHVELVPNGRVAVLNNTGLSENLPFLALPTLGIPRMARVAPEDIKQNPEGQKKPFELMHVQVGLEELVIPDVTALEQAYLEWKRG